MHPLPRSEYEEMIAKFLITLGMQADFSLRQGRCEAAGAPIDIPLLGFGRNAKCHGAVNDAFIPTRSVVSWFSVSDGRMNFLG